jgi:hypothetical protein
VGNSTAVLLYVRRLIVDMGAEIEGSVGTGTDATVASSEEGVNTELSKCGKGIDREIPSTLS